MLSTSDFNLYHQNVYDLAIYFNFYLWKSLESVFLQRVAYVIKTYPDARELRMFTHDNDSDGISMKFSITNMLGMRKNNWISIIKHSNLYQADGKLNASKWKNSERVSIHIEAGKWHNMRYVSFTSPDSNYSTPISSKYGGNLSTDGLQDAKWLAYKLASCTDRNLQVLEVDFSSSSNSNSSISNSNSNSNNNSSSLILTNKEETLPNLFHDAEINDGFKLKLAPDFFSRKISLHPSDAPRVR